MAFSSRKAAPRQSLGTSLKGELLLIGLDTNVLLRFVLNDDSVQSRQARAFFASLTPGTSRGFLSLLVLCEFAWTLGKFFRYQREQVSQTIELLVGMAALEVESPEIVLRAVQQFRTSQSDFGDCCIAALAAAAGCTHTVTFDKAASRLHGMRLLDEAHA